MEMNTDINNYPFSDFPTLSSTNSNPRKKRARIRGDGAATVKPTKKPDPSAPKITPPCTECGKRFWSFKALFGHMRCHPERRWRGINPPPHLRRSAAYLTEEDHEVAAVLLTLANTPTSSDTTSRTVSQSMTYLSYSDQIPAVGTTTFECSGCKKVFGSSQTLGGHRASHKNVKGCCANNKSDDLMMMVVVKDDGGHRCGICFRVFASGQALGGHMRCHWEAAEVAAPPLQEDGDASSSGGLTLDLRLGF